MLKLISLTSPDRISSSPRFIPIYKAEERDAYFCRESRAVHHRVMVNLYERLIVVADVSRALVDLSKSAHSRPVIRVPLFPVLYNFPPPRRSPWVTSREHSVAPLSPLRINLWPRKRAGDCLCSRALGGLPMTFLRVLHCPYAPPPPLETNERCQFSANASSPFSSSICRYFNKIFVVHPSARYFIDTKQRILKDFNNSW